MSLPASRPETDYRAIRTVRTFWRPEKRHEAKVATPAHLLTQTHVSCPRKLLSQ